MEMNNIDPALLASQLTAENTNTGSVHVPTSPDADISMIVRLPISANLQPHPVVPTPPVFDLSELMNIPTPCASPYSTPVVSAVLPAYLGAEIPSMSLAAPTPAAVKDETPSRFGPDKDVFPILDLASDIRKRIYSFALFPRGLDLAPHPHFSSTSDWRMKPNALLQVSHQSREETIELYYDEFSVSTTKHSLLIPWLRSIDPAGRMALGLVAVREDFSDELGGKLEKQLAVAMREFQKAGVGLDKEGVMIA